MGPPPDRDMGPPGYASTPSNPTNGVAKGNVPPPQDLAEKYSRLKKRYFELEEVRIMRLTFITPCSLNAYLARSLSSLLHSRLLASRSTRWLKSNCSGPESAT